MEPIEQLIAKQPEADWIVDGVVCRRALHLLTGPNIATLRHVAVQMALSVVGGNDFCGRKSAPLGVGYIHKAIGDSIVARLFKDAGVVGDKDGETPIYVSDYGLTTFAPLHGADWASLVFIDDLESYHAQECRHHAKGLSEWQSLAMSLREVRGRASDKNVGYVVLHRQREEASIVRDVMAVHGIFDGVINVQPPAQGLRGVHLAVRHRDADPTRLHLSQSR